MLKVTNIRLAVGESEDRLADRVARSLRLSRDAVQRLRILRKSLDIRDKRRLEHVYTLAVGVADERRLLSQRRTNVSEWIAERFETPAPGERPMEHPPIVVGAGPGGLLAAYFLAEQGFRPIVLERGEAVHDRVRTVARFDAGGELDPESNYLFGEGGAGTFSDGKLTCRTTGPDAERVLEIFAKLKGKPSILYEARPHLGSNRLPAIVKAIRRQIIAFGGEIHFGRRLDRLEIAGGRVVAVHTPQGRIAADAVVLATGHSARDVYSMLVELGVPIEPKPFQMGVRIEQPQAVVTRAQYGETPAARLLGPADYTMKVHVGARDLFTFCMCAGGYVMPSVSEAGYFCTNGMSRSRHDSPFANSGLVVTVDPRSLPGSATDPLVGVRYQSAIEQSAFAMTGGTYQAPIQWARDFLEQRTAPSPPTSSYARGVQSKNLWELLPTDLAEDLRRGLPIMDERWQGRFLEAATLVAPEARGSCPVRIPRDPATRQTIVEGLYPVGEGAGYAGGIVSAAVDGLRTAKAIYATWRPPR